LRQAIDHRGNKALGKNDGATKPHLAYRWIGEMLDLPDGLTQLIKGDSAAIEKSPRVDRWLDPVWRAIEQPRAERLLHVGDRFRNGRLRDRQPRRCLSHAAALSDGQQHVQIAQLEVTPDSRRVPFHHGPSE